ncbi:phosphate regulon transcriptional regulatory protein PhoB [Candidatus Termititenax persephonae]|uniref:Phosphate regulon transcriptional regulatory protein PhoB n=1 Tax=Candidatus Termititenax persephonae TaxID=2218525 RepID=A0A388THI7_9BACT|nr:phosphate regulon transcriptional regulatory protein PhoB [Candidatus Termititenax persephonae]
MPLVAVLDDEPDIRELLTLNLQKAGFHVKEFAEPKIFFKYLSANLPDALILDLMLPGLDGLEICKRLRGQSRTAGLPIIMLTARTEETDKIVGLELGADDYVTKPFSPKELVARVKSLLRRQENPTAPKVLRIGKNIMLDAEKYEVLIDGKQADLTSTEFKILQMLGEKQGLVFSRDKILDRLWGNEKAVFDRTIDVHVRHLRAKMGKYADYLKNIRGVGYKLVWS